MTVKKEPALHVVFDNADVAQHMSHFPEQAQEWINDTILEDPTFYAEIGPLTAHPLYKLTAEELAYLNTMPEDTKCLA